MRHCNEEIEELLRVAACPIPPDLLSENKSISLSNVGSVPQRTFLHPILGIDTPSGPTATAAPAPPPYEDMHLTGTEFLLSVADTSRFLPLMAPLMPNRLVGGRDMTRAQMTQNLRYAFNGLHSPNVFADVANDYLFLPSLPWMQRHKEIGEHC